MSKAVKRVEHFLRLPGGRCAARLSASIIRVLLRHAAMEIAFESEYPVTDTACREATGKSFLEWFDTIVSAGLESKRRDAINLIYDETGRAKDVWWPTTIWVEFERDRGIVQRDGGPEGYNICCTKGLSMTAAEVYPHFATDKALDSWVQGWSGPIVECAEFECAGCAGTVGRIRENKDICLNWRSPGFAPSDVEIQFNERGGKTTVNIYHKRIETRAEADGLRRAWGEALNRLKERVTAS